MTIAEGEASGRLRVLVVTVAGGGVGGMQQHTHDLVRGLVAAGHDVEVACPDALGLAEDLYGARWTLLQTTGRSDPRWGDKVLAAYREAQARGLLDIVHSESTSAVALIRHEVPTPVTIMYHGNYLSLSKAHLRRTLARPRSAPREGRELGRLTWKYLRNRNAFAFRHCESMVVSRQQLRDTARASLTPVERFHVVPNGVDVTLFRPREKAAQRRALGLGSGDLVLTTVGRLNHEKGFDVALSATARVRADYPAIRLLVVGDGEERAMLERLAGRLGIEEATNFLGRQPPERVAECLAASDLFLFPTRREEAGPLVLPQAMASGLAVVASRIGGIPEVLEPAGGDRAGVLVRPGSAAELEAAVRALLADEPRRTQLGAAARQRAVDEYSLDKMVARTVAVYRQAIARSLTDQP